MGRSFVLQRVGSAVLKRDDVIHDEGHRVGILEVGINDVSADMARRRTAGEDGAVAISDGTVALRHRCA